MTWIFCYPWRSPQGWPRQSSSPSTAFPLLLDDPEGHVGHVWICYQLDPLQFDMFGTKVIEQPDAVPQQYGDQVYVYFVQYPRLETLLDEASSANRDVLLASGSPGLIDGALHTVGDEGERRPLVVPSVGDGVGQDEDRDVLAYGMSAAPTVRDVERPPSVTIAPIEEKASCSISAAWDETLNVIPPL